MANNRYKKIIFISIIVCLFSVIFSICAGSVKISINDVFKKDPTVINIIVYSRLPRTIAAFFAGAALSVAGTLLQKVLSNNLASPSIIGVNAGAGLGVTVCCALELLSGFTVSVFAFLGSLLSIIIISIFGIKTQASKSTVILGGVALNAIISSISESIMALKPEVSMLTTDFKIGGFSSISYNRLIPSVIIIALTLLVLTFLLNELDVLALGDDTSKSIGLNTKKYRIIFLILCALLAGAAVSFAGLIGFIGLIVPHFVKKIASPQSKIAIPLCILMGGSFVCICDTLARIVFRPFELPVGIIMGIIGGPIFVTILIKGARTDA